jgi:outer membrane protein insertion porin family
LKNNQNPYGFHRIKTWLSLAGMLVMAQILMQSCTGLGRISEGEYLLTENKLTFKNKHDITDFKQTRQQFEDKQSPDPNGKFLWMRPGPSIYNTITEPKSKKGILHWLKNQVGAPPTMLDTVACTNLIRTYENLLYHQGNFNAHVDYEITRTKKTASVNYIINAGQLFLIDTLMMPEIQDSLTLSIGNTLAESLIAKGSPYSLELMKLERQRIETELRNQGYYYFSKENLIFLIDSANENDQVRLKLMLKSDTPPVARERYTVDKISVAEDFRLQDYHPDTLQHGDYTIYSASNYMKPRIFLNSVLFKPGDYYSREKYNNSIRQLMSFQTYRYANIRYRDIGNNKLNAYYEMTPAQKMSVSAELNAVSKSNSFAGPGVLLSFKSKNFFRGAEMFSLNFSGRFEKQVNAQGEGDTAWEVSMDSKLEIPHLMPLKPQQRNSPYLPTSNLTMGFGRYARVSLYKFNTFGTGLEYVWRKNEFLAHLLKPIDISITNLSETTPEFEEFLKYNPSIQKSFENQFIIGVSYNFIINKLNKPTGVKYYFSGGIDPSGNLVALVNKIGGSGDSTVDPATIFGRPVSQHFRARTDFRHYIDVGRQSQLVSRLYAGAGIPYGNSVVMPYVKQFFAGGTNSMRAFRARSLGPGTYIPPDSLVNVLVDQTGEIKLELNIEYRFPIVKYLKGALFTDIGNVWLVNADTLRPGGEFQFADFYKEAGIGMGLGLRVDLTMVVIRFDFAFPVRKPWLPESERWVFDEMDLLSKKWRRDNLLLNISIGYPF